MYGEDGKRAWEYLSSTVPAGTRLLLEFDEQERDPNDRLTAYAYLPDGRMLNALLAEGGIAQVLRKHYNNRYDDLFSTLEADARDAGRGLWPAYLVRHQGELGGSIPGDAADVEEAIRHAAEQERLELCKEFLKYSPEEFYAITGRWPTEADYAAMQAQCGDN